MVTEQQRIDIERLVANGNKIGAIKAYRSLTGCDLAAAKQAVDTMADEVQAGSGHGDYVNVLHPDSANLSQVIEALSNDRVIEAIKLYRELTGAGLKESKDAVEDLRRRMQGISPQQETPFFTHDQKTPAKSSSLGLIEETSKKSIGGIVFMLAIVLFIVLWWLGVI